MRRLSLHAALLAAPLFLAACAPVPPRPGSVATIASAESVGLAKVPAMPWPSADWWRGYRDARLERLIDDALAGSPGVRLAAARLREADRRAELAAANAGVSLALNGVSSRERNTGNGIIPPPFRGALMTNSRLAIDFSTEIDWWGRNRALIESAIGQKLAAQADTVAARVMLASAIAQGYFQIQADLRRLAVARAAVGVREQIAALDEARIARGLDTALVRRQREGEIAAGRLQVELIEAELALSHNRIAALTGKAPGALSAIAEAPLPGVLFASAAEVPVDLVGRRADVAASRWRVESAARLEDAAVAQFYPNLGVSAFAGFSAIGLVNVIRGSSGIYGVAPAFRLPLFDSGRLAANLGVQRAQIETAVEQYNQTLVEAVHEAADQIAQLRSVELQRQRAEEGLLALRALLELSQARLDAGLADASPLLNVRLQLLAQEDALAVLRGRLLASDALLARALGGGYGHESSGSGNESSGSIHESSGPINESSGYGRESSARGAAMAGPGGAAPVTLGRDEHGTTR